MKADFEVTYSSGRTESLTASGPKAIKEMRKDLERARGLGAVTSVKEKTFATEEQRVSDRKRQAATFLKPSTVASLQERAIQNNTSVSAEIAKLVEA